MCETHFRIVCTSGLHRWGTQREASMCCNGWTRVCAPIFYGSKHVAKVQWYDAGTPPAFSLTLVPSGDISEMHRLAAIVPDDVKAVLDLQFLNAQ